MKNDGGGNHQKPNPDTQNHLTLAQALRHYKALLRQGLITQAEYEEKRTQLLSKQ